MPLALPPTITHALRIACLVVVCFLMLPAAYARPADPVPATALRASLLYGDGEFSSFAPAPSNVARTRSLHETPPPASNRDPWLGRDKAQHLVFSALLTVGTQYALVNKITWSEHRALPVSAGFTGLVGLSKEVYDRHAKPNGLFSKKDLVADALGIALAVGFILL